MSVEVGQTRQCVDELYFSLYQRALHPELFHIHQVKRIEHRQYNAEIWITGLAHVITVQFGEFYMTELVAEENELQPRVGLANTFRLRGDRDYSQSFPGGLRYILSSQVERMSANLYPSTHRDMLRYAKRRGIYTAFEEWSHEELTPFTFIDYEPRDAEFHVHAYHVFPFERTIVKTQSIFEIERKERTNGH